MSEIKVNATAAMMAAIETRLGMRADLQRFGCVEYRAEILRSMHVVTSRDRMAQVMTGTWSV